MRQRVRAKNWRVEKLEKIKRMYKCLLSERLTSDVFMPIPTLSLLIRSEGNEGG